MAVVHYVSTQILSASLLLRARPPGPEEQGPRNPIDQLAVDLHVNSLNNSLELEAAGLTPCHAGAKKAPELAHVTSAPGPSHSSPSSALITPDVAFPPSLLSPSFQHMVRRQRSVDHRLRTAGLTHALPGDSGSNTRGRKKPPLNR